MTFLMILAAALAAAYILLPLLRPARAGVNRARPPAREAAAAALEEALARDLRELELDLRAGKMTASDYARAVAEIQQRARTPDAGSVA